MKSTSISPEEGRKRDKWAKVRGGLDKWPLLW